MILGIDEVGRGPWAGPLVVGAVVLGRQIEGITDSKKLSLKKRTALDDKIRTDACAVGLGWVSPSEIDTLGLASALELACKRAVEEVDALGVAYHEIIIDGTVNFLKNTSKSQYVTTMKKADLFVPSVGAASIVAKVARDNYMKQQSAVYPKYGFAAHVGYGTAAHQAALNAHGVTPLHRLSFAPLRKFKVHSELVSASEDASADDSVAIRATTKSIGDDAESVVAEYMAHRGYVVLERNWRTKFCEVDIICQKDDTVYFVEVKYRKNDRAGDGLAMITPKKLRQMQFAAGLYATKANARNVNLRLVAVAVTGKPPRVTDYVEIV